MTKFGTAYEDCAGAVADGNELFEMLRDVGVKFYEIRSRLNRTDSTSVLPTMFFALRLEEVLTAALEHSVGFAEELRDMGRELDAHTPITSANDRASATMRYWERADANFAVRVAAHACEHDGRAEFMRRIQQHATDIARERAVNLGLVEQ
ncbi:hypothetical protein [Mycolicibacter arupensis]|uniref:hypothetical protein n=1 Tax=Mycolicibacter arupensis TaxID=342002 RepID=UPI0023F13023|nr:hypothetical protein [Mycolicibacter arupensis]